METTLNNIIPIGPPPRQLPIWKKVGCAIILFGLSAIIWYFIVQIGSEKWHLEKQHYEEIYFVDYGHNLQKTDCITSIKETDCMNIMWNNAPSPSNVSGKCCSSYDVVNSTQCLLCNYTYANSTNMVLYFHAKGSDFGQERGVFMRIETITCTGNLDERTNCLNEYKKNVKLRNVYCSISDQQKMQCSYESDYKWLIISIVIILLAIFAIWCLAWGYIVLSRDNFFEEIKEINMYERFELAEIKNEDIQQV
ncbi:MAG: hypothetical protein Edafosvirus6_38 [Edafosvirus sp.]|uniref:Transmembrane protein n=1 Tax=Edafosvirus sp. TaxID=2487765 RepID=A0A3G4ZXP2_9VIRU|nr:MAG: hypothetical protein Edafosvirus6_38 [Edafosvirus sp.]